MTARKTTKTKGRAAPPNGNFAHCADEPPSASDSLSHQMGEGWGEGQVHGEVDGFGKKCTAIVVPRDNCARKGLESLTESERLLLAEMVMALPLAEAQRRVAGSPEAGGFDLELSQDEIERFYLEVQKAAVQASQKNIGEINRITIEEDIYRRIGTPVLCLLQQRLQKMLGMAEPKPDEIKTYFTLLLASRKLDLIEKKALDASERPKARSEEEKMEMIWDMFALPEEERARRRALWKQYQKQSPDEQQAVVDNLSGEELK